MKIFIGTTDICGLLPLYKKGFELNGYTATTGVISSNQNPYYTNRYDLYLDNYAKSMASKYSSRLIKSLSFRLANFFEKKNPKKYQKKLIDKLIEEHDVFIFLWSGLSKDDSEYELLKIKNKKIISIFVGSDVRYFKAFKQHFKVDEWRFPEDYENETIERTIKKIRIAEKYSDIILSVPDQSLMGLRPYNHFQIPVDTTSLKFNIPAREIPRVIHAPSRPWLKGTDIIEKTLEKLKDEGVKFEFISIRGMNNDELKNLLADADVLIDEIILHGPGVLSFEAMACGCAVATRYLESSPSCFKPPIMNINASNIYQNLKLLLTNKSLRVELAQKARTYVEENNNPKKITSEIIKNLVSPQSEYHYYPKFLRVHYESSDINEIETINNCTKFVQPCSWYNQFISKGERDKFSF